VAAVDPVIRSFRSVGGSRCRDRVSSGRAPRQTWPRRGERRRRGGAERGGRGGHGRGAGDRPATAQRLARDGFEVVAADLDADGAATTAALVGGTARQLDVTDRAAVMAVAGSLGRCHVLVNNAAIWRYHTLADLPEEAARDVVAVNLLGVLWCTQAFAPLIEASGGGSIVNVSSGAVPMAASGVGIYPSTKGAVEILTRQSALELGPRGIRVNCVGPGAIVTEGTADRYAGGVAERRARLVPLGRVGDPTDIADVIAFFVSHDARYVSGQVLYVDGGQTAGQPIPR
jgi:3-oxoacyl-[acyl-carrier protein] reductase